MKGHGQFCPVAIASDLFAHRWTPLVLRELFAGASQFNEIKRALPLMSRTTLALRLRELEGAGVVECVPHGAAHRYRLTASGEEFRPVIAALATWGQRWGARFDPQNLDPGLLMWNVRRRLVAERLPPRRTLAQFDFSGTAPGYRRERRFWLFLEDGCAELCITDPGIEPDLWVAADIKAFAQVWLGDLTFAAARGSGAIKVTGRRELVKDFPAWLKCSPYKDVPRPAQPA